MTDGHLNDHDQFLTEIRAQYFADQPGKAMEQVQTARDSYFPAQPLADFSASKWSLPLAYRLVTAASPMRFRDVKRDIPGVSGQELTRLLKLFERQGLLIRREHLETARRVTYQPTMTLLEALSGLEALAHWARSLADSLSAIREAP